MESQVNLARYSGPYTKLLELIEQRKLSITEIDLVSVADEYITHIQSLDNEDIIDISQFIVVASTLMLMKAKSLLPGVVYTEEEEKQVYDLEYKLALYAILSGAASKVRSIYMKNPLYRRERLSYKNITVFVPDNKVTPVLLETIARLTLASFITPKQLVKVAVEHALRMENVIESLLARVKNMQSVTLMGLAGGAKTVEERKKLLIVNFLALLELLRNGTIRANQASVGSDIEIAGTT